MSEPARDVVWTSIMDVGIRALASQAESSQADADLLKLVSALATRCSLPEVKARYALPIPVVPAGIYPLDAEGYGRAFDPLEEERDFWECWHTRGIVVGHAVVSPAPLQATVARMRELLYALAGPALDLEVPSTWNALPADPAGVPFVSRGFFELYHDSVLATLRQSVRAYLHHVLLWGRTDLWVSFDRLGLKLPQHGEAAALPLHVDQNPLVHPEFRTVQGVLALEDRPSERGTFVGASGSRGLFAAYADMAPARGEYVELTVGSAMREHIAAHPLPLRAGDMVSWDSRTTHANSANVSDKPRWVAYIAAGPSRSHDPQARAARLAAYVSGKGGNVRDALMHASKKPRFTDPALLSSLRRPEHLTALGRLLYGLDDYPCML